MEEITERLSYVKLAPQKSDAFLRAFEKIVAYARELRGGQLSDAEIDVTRRLAGPFTCGGLLILLIEPRQQHPWRQGIHTVILDCATLNALREGVHIGSNGALSLADDMTVLDLRPFVWAGLKDRLEEGQLVKLYDLVIGAISAKRPDTILCMGNERRNELESRRGQLPHTRLIYAKHPSYSVNYNSDCIVERKSLLKSILDGCGHIDNPKDSYLFTDRGYTSPIRQASCAEEAECVINLLRLLVELCLGPRLRLPQLNLESKGFYRLEGWHIRYFTSHRRKVDGPNDCRQSRITAVLAPIFEALNRCISPDSIYLQRYKVDWKQLPEEMKDALSRVDQLCEFLAHDNFNDDIDYLAADRRDSGTESYGELNKQVVILQLEAIRLRLAPVLQSMQPQLKRSRVWVGIAE